MLWDDLQLLRWIDELETSGSHLGNGYFLLESVGRLAGVQPHEDMRGFAIELTLAHNAGYLTWTDRSSRMVGQYSPTLDPGNWLQTIDDIKLTLAGRDRARGRVIQVELPDPEEDDGRIITGMTMEEIAKSIGETYTATQLPRFLRESGVPTDVESVPGDRMQFVFAILDSLHEGGSAARRTLRAFVGAWLAGNLHAPPPPEVRKRITSLLAQQGWHVRDGRLVIGERVQVEPGAVPPLRRDARLAALHERIRRIADRYAEEHLNVAIFEAFKAVTNRVKEMTELDLDGSKLMDAALNRNDPRLLLGDLTTESGRNVQQGFHFIFKGAVEGIRNPKAHDEFEALDEEEGLEELGFASMLMRRLDSAEVRRFGGPSPET